jgi:hypothetical protein
MSYLEERGRKKKKKKKGGKKIKKKPDMAGPEQRHPVYY